MAIEWTETRHTTCQLTVLRDGMQVDPATPEDLRAAGYEPAGERGATILRVEAEWDAARAEAKRLREQVRVLQDERTACLDILCEHGGTLLDRVVKAVDNNARNAHTATELSAEVTRLRNRVHIDTLLIQGLFEHVPRELAPGSPHISDAVKALADAYAKSRAECERLERAVVLYASEIKDAGAEIERLKAELARCDAKPEKVSETCRRTGVQACHICDDLGCGDNMSARGQK